ncbi:MAG: hypothetical protein IKA19_02615 [Muribaculaceae bacterium]|nr:hypothetical protein [Muribaculaceae bacterium]
MKNFFFSFGVILIISLSACGGGDSLTKNCNSPEEELQVILQNDGWELISNSTNIYRKELSYDGGYDCNYWYTASIFCKENGGQTKYIVARVVYNDTDAQRHSDGKLKYKTFSIVECDYTSKYGTPYNGYINDGGSTGYLNY